MILKASARNLSEREHIALRESVNSIGKIAQVFLEYSPAKESSVDFQYVLVSQALGEVVAQKETQYSDKDVKFHYSFDPALRFTFIHGNALNFERMISNIINNSAEAFEGKQGLVKIGFTTADASVKITIRDSGKGMPSEIVEKLMRNESVSTTKKGGYGVGTGQIRDALQEFQGSQCIESTPGAGTKITLTIPKSAKAPWAIERITCARGDAVVVLDDDILAHRLWRDRFKKYLSDISLNFFEKGQEAVDFINSQGNKEHILLLADHELRNQPLNGLDVIQKSALKNFQSVLVSSIYNRKEIQDKAGELGIKILPKAFINDVPIIGDEETDDELSLADAKVVVLDDEKYLANLIGDHLRSNGLAVDTYYNPGDLIKNLSKYDVSTKIITDNCLGAMTGDVLARELLAKGFKNLCVLTGLITEKTYLKYPEGTKILEKASADAEERILSWCKTGR
jgi:CheY-like chemotaxis protein/two-component sensor histidine kinase